MSLGKSSNSEQFSDPEEIEAQIGAELAQAFKNYEDAFEKYNSTDNATHPEEFRNALQAWHTARATLEKLSMSLPVDHGENREFTQNIGSFQTLVRGYGSTLSKLDWSKPRNTVYTLINLQRTKGSIGYSNDELINISPEKQTELTKYETELRGFIQP